LQQKEQDIEDLKVDLGREQHLKNELNQKLTILYKTRSRLNECSEFKRLVRHPHKASNIRCNLHKKSKKSSISKQTWAENTENST